LWYEEVAKLLQTSDLMDLQHTKEHPPNTATCVGSGNLFSPSLAFQTRRHFQKSYGYRNPSDRIRRRTNWYVYTNTHDVISKQYRQFTYNVTFMSVRAIIVAVERQ
jgi:hypothetical protein